MYNMFDSIKAALSNASDHIANARFARLRSQLPVTSKLVKLGGRGTIFHSMFYDLPKCPDSAGYFALENEGERLYLTWLLEKDYRGPGFKDSVFVDGKKLPTDVHGQIVERLIPWDAEIMYMDSKEVVQDGRSRWEPHLVQVHPARDSRYCGYRS
jgi:hypothetical protein